jgi:hypothetical protein
MMTIGQLQSTAALPQGKESQIDPIPCYFEGDISLAVGANRAAVPESLSQ